MKTESNCRFRSRRMLIVAGLAVCAFANAADFDTTVWRGETAYVDIPEGVRSRELVTSGQKSGVSIALGYYDEVAYEMQPNGVDVRKRPDVYREDGRRPPTVVRVTAAPDANPGIFSFGPREVSVSVRVLTQA